MKPLFTEEAVQTAQPVLMPNSLGTTNAVVPATNKALVIVTDDQIDKIGERNSTTAASFSTQMLSSIKASDVDEFGNKLNALVSTAKGLDPSKFGKPGILGKFLGLFGSLKEKMLAEYQSVETRMDTLVGELDKSAKLQTQRIGDLEQMFNINIKVHEGFENDISEVNKLIVSLKEQLEHEKSVVNNDAFGAQKVADIQGRIDRSEKKIDDLERGKLLCKQLAPQIRLMQSNARSLAQKFGDVKKVTIPAWKNAFTLFIVNIEQKKGAALANTVHDATDDAFRMQADLLRQNTQEIAKANQRSVVSTDVLVHMQNQLLGAIDDVIKITDEGKQQRATARPQLEQLEKDLIAKFNPQK